MEEIFIVDNKEPEMVIENVQQEFTITFHNELNDVGKLYWDDRVLRFEGNMDESAKVFVNQFIGPNLKIYLEENNGK